MRNFIVYSLWALVVQTLMIAFVFTTGIGDGLVWLLYVIPYLVIGVISGAREQPGPSEDSTITILLLLAIPVFLYSAIIGYAVAVRRRR
jgi:hypothetical protein